MASHSFYITIVPFETQPQDKVTWITHLGMMFNGRASLKIHPSLCCCPFHDIPLEEQGGGSWICWECVNKSNPIMQQQKETIEKLKKTLHSIENIIKNE